MSAITTPVADKALCRLELRQSQHKSFTQYHLTANIELASEPAQAAAELLLAVAQVLKSKGIQIVQEKLYGLRSCKAEVLLLRSRIYADHGLDPEIPFTWIEGVPLKGCAFVGLQIWGLASAKGQTLVTTVTTPSVGKARLWTGEDFRMLHLPCVRGQNADGSLPSGHAAQADRMFLNAGNALDSQGMSYRNVARTWIYLSRLLEWYNDLNRIRNGHYRPAGLGAPGGPAFPASTGIQGRSDEEECLFDVLAVDLAEGSTARVVPVNRSPRQDQSFLYGSAFSRGMVIEVDGVRTVHISGTASINCAGESTNLGDPEYQCLETLLSISAILKDHGGRLDQIVSSTLFCKTEASWHAWRRMTELLQLPSFPMVVVLADVCRDNLLVEMEAVAVLPSSTL